MNPAERVNCPVCMGSIAVEHKPSRNVSNGHGGGHEGGVSERLVSQVTKSEKLLRWRERPFDALPMFLQYRDPLSNRLS